MDKIKNSKSEEDICYRGYIKKHLNPYFKNYDIDKITQEDISKYRSHKSEQGYSVSSIGRFLAAFRKIMKRNGNNYKHINFSAKNTVAVIEKNILNNDEIKNLVKNFPPELCIVSLGINPAELSVLEYSDIDFENKTAVINKVLYKNTIQKHRKLYKIKTLKIPSILFDKLIKNTGSKIGGRIFKNIKIENYDLLLNTHIHLLLKKNVPLNIIRKNLGMQCLNDFENRFGFLLPQKLDDGFEILK